MGYCYHDRVISTRIVILYYYIRRWLRLQTWIDVSRFLKGSQQVAALAVPAQHSMLYVPRWFDNLPFYFFLTPDKYFWHPVPNTRTSVYFAALYHSIWVSVCVSHSRSPLRGFQLFGCGDRPPDCYIKVHLSLPVGHWIIKKKLYIKRIDSSFWLFRIPLS